MEHLQEVVSHVGTGVMCPVASMSRVLNQFSSPTHCDCVHCGTLLELVSQRICSSATTASTVTELVTSSLQLPSQHT